jgi:hypothetical protein
VTEEAAEEEEENPIDQSAVLDELFRPALLDLPYQIDWFTLPDDTVPRRSGS